MKRRILPTLVAASLACWLGGANAASVLAPDDDEEAGEPPGAASVPGEPELAPSCAVGAASATPNSMQSSTVE